MQEVHEAGLDELCLWEGCDHSQDRLIRKEDRAFRHGVDLAGEA
jgi:hypothetical protein